MTMSRLLPLFSEKTFLFLKIYWLTFDLYCSEITCENIQKNLLKTNLSEFEILLALLGTLQQNLVCPSNPHKTRNLSEETKS